MGSRMAQNLLNKGIDVTVYNRSNGPAQALAESGASFQPDVSIAVKEADLVLTMLSDPQAVDAVSTAFLPSMTADTIWIDCSTVDPDFSLNMAERANQYDIRFADAPVAGTLPHAERAELVFFVGADPEDFLQIAPVLNHMGRAVLHLGEVSRGTAYKLLVNAQLGLAMAAFSETIVMGEKLGFDRTFLIEQLSQGPVAPPFLQFKSDMLKSGRYDAQFPLELMLKDLRLVTDTAQRLGIKHHLAETAAHIYQHASSRKLGRQDFAAILQYLEETN